MDIALETGVPHASDPPEADHSRRLRWQPNPDLRDLLATRLDELPAAEQALIQYLYLDGRPTAEVAALVEQDPRSVRRRGRRIASRVLSGEFAFVLRQRNLWPIRRRRLATAVFLHGKSVRKAAAELGISEYLARREHRVILGLYEAFCAAERGGR